MEIGSKLPGIAALQRRLANLDSTVTPVKQPALPQVLSQLVSGYSAQGNAPVNLTPSLGQVASSSIAPMSLRDVQKYQQSGATSLTQTNAYVDQLTRVLSPEDKAMITGKVGELLRDGRSVEQTNPARFAANLALEVSEYIGEGKPVSPQLNAVFHKLLQDGKSVFDSNPQANAVLQNNLAARANNLPNPLSSIPGTDQTRAAVARMTANLSPADRTLVQNKAAELAREGLSLDKIGPARFSANMALELSEHIGEGGDLSPQLNTLFQQLVKDGDAVFRQNPKALEVINHNLEARAKNLN
jgi:hypothetical protein